LIKSLSIPSNLSSFGESIIPRTSTPNIWYPEATIRRIPCPPPQPPLQPTTTTTAITIGFYLWLPSGPFNTVSADGKTNDGASDAGSLLDSVLGKLSTLAEQVAEIARLQQDQQSALQRLESQKSSTSTFSKGFVGFAMKQPILSLFWGSINKISRNLMVRVIHLLSSMVVKRFFMVTKSLRRKCGWPRYIS
jgi:hypothetical protein